MFDWITPQIAPIMWLVLGIIFAVTEGLTVQLTAIWFALGAAAGAVSALLGATPLNQFLIFVVISGVLMLCTRPFAKKALTVKTQHTNADRAVGQTGMVTIPIDNDLAAGRAAVMGLDWSARSQNGTPIESGIKIKVLAIEGVNLIVEPYTQQPETKA